MSKHLRFIAVLALCLMMTLSACSALAAPKLKLAEVPSKEIRGGADFTITVSASDPGFLTLTLLKDKETVATFAENLEIHTQNNEIDLVAVNDEGTEIAPGKYTVSAVMVDQFGVSSEAVTKSISFKEPKSEEEETEAAPTATPKPSSSDKNTTSKATAVPKTTTGKTASKSSIKITAQPKDVKAASGKAVEISVVAKGDGLTYQWFYKMATGSKFSKATTDSATSPTYTTTMTEKRDGMQMYCLIRDKNGSSVKSDTVTLSMSASSTSSKKKATAAPKPTNTPKPSEAITYTTGVCEVDEQGYEIGVGVSDAAKTAKGYWALTSDSSDAEIWAAMQEKMIAVNVGENENAYIYSSPEEGRKRLGTVSGTSQGLNVITEVGNWSLVEAFRIEDGAFVRGYIRSNKLRTVEPNPNYGIVIDKNTQTLIVYKDGARIGSTPVSTGLPTYKYPHRETPAGEYITVTRRGTIEYYGMGYSKCTVRVGGSYHLCEIPTTKKGGSDYSMLESSLGSKATRGNIVVAHNASSDGGINAEWLWDLTDENKRIKVLILDDKDRSSVPVSE